MSSAESTLDVGRGLVDYTHWIYGLHRLAVLLALGHGAHAIAMRFAFSLPSIVALPMVIVLIGIAVEIIGLVAIGIWVIYRIARGWLALRDGRALPMPA